MAAEEPGAESLGADERKTRSFLAGGRLFSKRSITLCMRRQRKLIQLVLIGTIALIFFSVLVATVLADSTGPQIKEDRRKKQRDPRYRTHDIPEEAWLAAGWGLPPKLREANLTGPAKNSGSSPGSTTPLLQTPLLAASPPPLVADSQVVDASSAASTAALPQQQVPLEERSTTIEQKETELFSTARAAI